MRDARAIRQRYALPELEALGRDLAHVRRWEATLSLAIPWCCLVIYACASVLGWWTVAVLAVVLMSFFTYGSVSHDLVHGNLRLRPLANDALLCLTELLAVRSGHAYRAAHLHHHRRFPADDDIEGAAAGFGFVRSLAEGFVLQPKVWLWAMRHAKRSRGWVLGEGVACVALIVGSIVATQWTLAPVVYVALCVGGSWIIPLVTSYIPHDAGAADPLHQTRLFRGRLSSLIALEHLYHLEHHLYPRVPHHRWAELARALDPHFRRAGVPSTRLSRRGLEPACTDASCSADAGPAIGAVGPPRSPRRD